MDMNILRTCVSAAGIMFATGISAELVAGFDMSVSSGKIEETVSREHFDVLGNFAPENVAGASGQALRFDGYTSRINARLGDILGENAKKMTVAMWVAVPCYPIIQIDTDTSEKTAIATCLDTENKTGFGFYLGFDGRYSFRTYIGGWPVDLNVDTPLPTYRWNRLVAVIDCEARSVKLYNNGEEVASGKANGSISFGPCDFYMGQSTESRKSGPFELMSFNGLIDDISIWNDALDPAALGDTEPENAPDLDIPASRFADDILRPRFHGMPAAGWTNECHGMYHSDGRYHLFFQKNADGPYMARLHWGHISSENLYDWREEKIAIAPGDWYDIKGCWSGCVFADEDLTGGKPNAIYTAVDYAKAMIAQASPDSDTLDDWTKSSSNPIINGRPAGLSDDFRDPYFFRNGSDAYIIVGSSRNGTGTTTLHKYNPVSRSWSNNGDLFFSGTSQPQDGSFWEMPNITLMPDGRWLFTATPLNTREGVRTLYWTGSITDDGHFSPDAASAVPRLMEMNSRHGFGMLSPTVFRTGDKTIALGIVPDKLPAQTNWNLGWAHCYSLPREWRLADDGTLLQKPFEGLSGLRTDVSFSKSDTEINGTLDLGDVDGRSLELLGIFETSASPFGFRIFGNGNAWGEISYNPASGEIIADFSRLTRLQNDAGIYDGIYRCPLPERPAVGSDLKLNVFVDHSIIDIFVNDKWATSIRVFPTDADAVATEVFSEGPTKAREITGWILDPDSDGSGIHDISAATGTSRKSTDVYCINGIKAASAATASEALEGLPAGLYTVDNRKILVR